jgi:hypothetical protein
MSTGAMSIIMLASANIHSCSVWVCGLDGRYAPHGVHQGEHGPVLMSAHCTMVRAILLFQLDMYYYHFR